MIIGFTGTRNGLTEQQYAAVHGALAASLFDRIFKVEFHHGDCLGSDAQAAEIARNLGYRIISHPPIDPKHRAYVPADFEFIEREYLDRNKDIVDCAMLLVATPGQWAEQQRSGTWSTIRYARRTGVPVLIVYPDGSGSFERK